MNVSEKLNRKLTPAGSVVASGNIDTFDWKVYKAAFEDLNENGGIGRANPKGRDCIEEISAQVGMAHKVLIASERMPGFHHEARDEDNYRLRVSPIIGAKRDGTIAEIGGKFELITLKSKMTRRFSGYRGSKRRSPKLSV